jgi:hypothetical protein
MYAPNANIVSGSFDRIRGTLFSPSSQPINNFLIQTTGGNIVQGQINKISVTEVMMPYNTPTIVTGKNNMLFLRVFTSTGGATPASIAAQSIAVSQAFYTAAELAAAIQAAVIAAVPALAGVFTANINTRTNSIVFSNLQTYNAAAVNYFIDLAPNIYSSTPPASNPFSFPDLLWTSGLRNLWAANPPNPDVGVNPDGRGNELVPASTPNNLIPSGGWPTITGSPFTGRYTDYIDIVSTTLCQAQYIRDSSTSQATPRRDIVARIYVCTNISTYTADPAGSRPFTIYRNWTNPKIIKWTVDRSIDSVDLQLYDMYGQPLPSTLSTPIPLVANQGAECGASDYAITLHVHEPGVEVQNENVGYKF